MSPASTQNEIGAVNLATDDGRVRAQIIPELGGGVASLLLPGPDGRPRECLFRHAWYMDPLAQETRGGIPVLFPICGRLLKNGEAGLYHVAGRPFHLPRHGFAMRRPWTVAAARSDRVVLQLADSPETRAVYPFAFRLELRFAVEPQGFSARLTVANTGTRPMPYVAGFHPYFATPPPGQGKEQTLFAARFRARRLYNETRTDVVRSAPPPAMPLPVGGRDDLNGLLLEIGRPNHSRLVFPDGFILRQSASPLFRYRQLYTLPAEPFFCDEPWMAPPGALHHPGAARRLPPGASESGTIRISAGQV